MKYFILFVSSLFITACGDNAGTEKIKPTRFDKNFTMTVNFISDDKIKDFCSELGVTYEANGCTLFDLEKKHCNIFVVEPRYVSDHERMTVVGHETLHCVYGKYHQ